MLRAHWQVRGSDAHARVSAPPCALPPRHRLRGTPGAEERQRVRAKDGGAGRRETRVPGGALQRLLWPFNVGEIRQRHREHQRRER